MTLLTPSAILIIGRIWRKHPPKNINGATGYRTSMSMKNKQTWDFAHRYWSGICIRWSVAMLIVSAVLMVVNRDKDYETLSLILTFLQIFLLCLSIIPTERALRKRFDHDGKRKE